MDREELLAKLERHYENSGWAVRRDDDGTLVAAGPGGVEWLGMAIVAADFGSEETEGRLLDLADRRMNGVGELCPLDLIAGEEWSLP